MIQALNDIVIALALHRLRRRRFYVIDEDRIGDYMVRYVLDCGGYRIDAVAQTDGTVRVCGPNNEAISAAFDPYGSRAESLWLAQTIKDRIKEQATEGHDGL